MNDQVRFSGTDNYIATEDLMVAVNAAVTLERCLLYTSPSPRDAHESRMPSSA